MVISTINKHSIAYYKVKRKLLALYWYDKMPGSILLHAFILLPKKVVEIGLSNPLALYQ